MTLKTLIAAAFLVLLTACAGGEKITVQGSTLVVPQSLQECAGKPVKPKGGYTQKDVAKYITKLSAAHSDCALDLKALNKLVASSRKKK